MYERILLETSKICSTSEASQKVKHMPGLVRIVLIEEGGHWHLFLTSPESIVSLEIYQIWYRQLNFLILSIESQLSCSNISTNFSCQAAGSSCCWLDLGTLDCLFLSQEEWNHCLPLVRTRNCCGFNAIPALSSQTTQWGLLRGVLSRRGPPHQTDGVLYRS